MKMRLLIFMVLMCFTLSGFVCQRSLLKPDMFNSSGAVWQWTGDTQHTGYSSSLISPPFRLAWKHRTKSALGRAVVAFDSYLFYGTQNGLIQSLHAITGKRAGSFKTSGHNEVTCLAFRGFLIVADRSGSSTLKLVDLADEKVVWSKNLGFVDGEPLLTDSCIVVSDHHGRIYMFEDSTGELVWSRNIGGRMYSSPARVPGVVCAASENGIVMAVDDESGEILWKKELEGSIQDSPVIGDNLIYIGTREGRFYALSLSTGQIRWDIDVGGGVYETAAYHGSTVYMGSNRGLFRALNGLNGQELWRFNASGAVGTSPLITGKYVFLGTLNRLFYVLNRRTGEEVWRYETKGRISTSPMIWNGTLVFACDEKIIYGFREKR